MGLVASACVFSTCWHSWTYAHLQKLYVGLMPAVMPRVNAHVRKADRRVGNRVTASLSPGTQRYTIWHTEVKQQPYRVVLGKLLDSEIPSLFYCKDLVLI